VHLIEWRRAAAAGVVVALLSPVLAPAQAVDPELATGLRQVREGDFESAVVTLDAVARRLREDPGRRADLLEVYVNLGVAFVALDQRTAARERFRLALALDPKLELRSDRHSPKVIGVFEEARREARAAAKPPDSGAGAAAATGGHHSKLPLVLLGAGGAAAAIVLATRGSDGTTPGGDARFTGARFGTPVLVCPDGAVNLNLPLTVFVDAVGGRTTTTILSGSATLEIVASPSIPSEVGFASSAPATISPSTVPPGASLSLHVDTTLLCGNGIGDEPRYNDWKARITLSTSNGPVTFETVDRLRVNIP
jgi:hypothetical protein